MSGMVYGIVGCLCVTVACGMLPTGWYSYMWGTWSPWTFCNDSVISLCSGTIHRNRSCYWNPIYTPPPDTCVGDCVNVTNPNCTCTAFDVTAVQPDGMCSGFSSESQACPINVDGGWSDWVNGSCSVSCGRGQAVMGRYCDNPRHCNLGLDCQGNDSSVTDCDSPIIDGAWSDWGNWSGCSVTVGTGTKIQHRYCDNPPPCGGQDCMGADNHTDLCEVIPACFSSKVLDPQYDNTASPMLIYISAKVDIYSIVELKPRNCNHTLSPYYDWNMYYIDDVSSNETHLVRSYGLTYFPFRPTTTGLYGLDLRVYYSRGSNVWLEDEMFINVVFPPPHAVIMGGSVRVLGVGTHTIDGLSLSYDMSHGHGQTDTLEFRWVCTPLAIGSLYDTLNVDIVEDVIFPDDASNLRLVNHSFVTNRINDLALFIDNLTMFDYLNTSPLKANFCNPDVNLTTEFFDFDAQVTRNGNMYADLKNIIELLEYKFQFYQRFITFVDYSLASVTTTVNDVQNWVAILQTKIVPLQSLKTTINNIKTLIPEKHRHDYYHICDQSNSSYNALVSNMITSQSAIKSFSLTDWNSYAVNEELLRNATENILQNQTCPNFRETSRGYAELVVDLTDVVSKYGYIISMRVQANDSISYYQQRIQAIEGSPPVIDIGCRLNCLQKIASTSILSLRAECLSCTFDELSTITYAWNVFEFNMISKARTELPGWKERMESENYIPAFVMKPNTLNTDASYIIELNITLFGNSSSLTLVLMRTDIPPYGGETSQSSISGRAGITPFMMEFTGWNDEGYRRARNAGLDWKESLFYRLLARRGSDEPTLLYHGAERKATVYLPVGDPDQNHALDVLYRVYDIFGEYTQSVVTFTVLPPIDDITDNAVTSFVSTTDDNIDLAIETGNLKLVTMSVENAASSITDLDFPVSSIPEDTGSLVVMPTLTANITGYRWDNLWADYVNPPLGGAKENLSSVTDQYSAIMYNTTVAERGAELVTIKHLAQGVGSVVKDPALVGQSVVDTAVTTNDIILTMFQNASAADEYPLFADYEATSESILRVADNVLTSLVTTKSPNTPTSTDMYSVLQTILTTGEFGDAGQSGEMSAMERAFLVSQIAKSQQLQKNATDKTAMRYVPDIMGSISSLGEVLKGMVHLKQLPVSVTRPGVSTSMAAMTLPEMTSKPVVSDNIKMEFSQSHDNGVDNKDVQITVFEKNPFSWDAEAQYITSQVLSVSVKDNDDVEVNMSVKVRFPNRGDNQAKTVYLAFPTDTNEMSSQFFSTKFYWQFPHDEVAFRLEGDTNYKRFVVYLKGERGPTRTDYDWRYEVSDSDVTDHWFLVVIPGGTFTQGITAYFTVLVETRDGITRSRRSVGSVNDTADNSTASNSTVPPTHIVTYTATLWTSGCRVWNTAEGAWDKAACKMSVESVAQETVCVCDHPPGRHFATTFYVPPNSIDFDSVFDKFDIVSNGAVLGTLVSVLVLYVMAAVWAWRQDRRDKERWALSYIHDNEADQNYMYLVTVHTGLSRNAGTTSRVYMAVTSDRRDTGVRALDDGTNARFGTGSVRKFVMCVHNRLGNLTCLDIWHDNSGKGDDASWLVSKVDIMDLQCMERFTFICNQWLSLDDEDGALQKAFPVSEKEDLNSFRYHFRDNSRHCTTDRHLWLSVFLRPEESNFTRLQRLSCCLALLYLAMITSAMFYKTDSGQNQVSFGALKFSLNGIYISFMSIIISATPVVLITVIFQKSSKASPVKDMEDKAITTFANLPDIAQVDYAHCKRDEKSYLMPRWCVYIGWALVVCSVTVSGFFVMLYSMEWGQAKSEEWLMCFILSFFESVFITDPIKVIVIAFIVSYFFRKESVDKNVDLDIHQVLQEAKERVAAPEDKKEVVKADYPTTSQGREIIEKMREQRQKELKAKQVSLELFCYLLFIVVLYLISYSNRDNRSFQFREHINSHLLTSPLANSSGGTLRFDKIVRTEDFYVWMQNTLLPFVFPKTTYNGAPLTPAEKGYLDDQQNFRVGPVRLRQLRVRSDRCSVPLMAYQTCYDAYETTEEDSVSYCVGWVDGPCVPDEILKLSHSAWKFTSAIDLWGIPLLGDYSLYGGGGYLADLGVNYDVSHQTINELKNNAWIDRRTRGVFVEFTLYNSNINLFAYLSLLVEFPDTGGTNQYNFVHIFRTYQHHGSMGIFIFICEILFLVCISICFVKMLKSLCKRQLKVFEDRWQILNWTCLVLTITAIAMFTTRWIFTKMTIDNFTKNKYKFVNFSHIAVWDEILASFIAFLVFLATFRLMQILNYNQRITQLTAVLNHCSRDLTACFIMFAIVFFAYVSVGYLLFGRVLHTYRNLLIAMTTITNALIGRNNIASLIETTPVLAQFYYTTFVFFVMWILMTMINATLNKSISIIRLQQRQSSVPFGVHDLAVCALKEFVALIKDKRQKYNTPKDEHVYPV